MIARYAVGSVVIAAIAGTAAFTVALVAVSRWLPCSACGQRCPTSFRRWAAIWERRRSCCSALTTGTDKGLLIPATYLIYMQIENRVIQPIIVSKAVDIPPFVAMVAVLVGSAAAGVVGAVLVTPMVAVAKELHRAFRGDDGDDGGHYSSKTSM